MYPTRLTRDHLLHTLCTHTPDTTHTDAWELTTTLIDLTDALARHDYPSALHIHTLTTTKTNERPDHTHPTN